MELRIEDICRGVDMLVDEEKKMFNNITKMSETRFDKSLTDKVTKKLFDIDMDISLENYLMKDDLSTAKKNKVSSSQAGGPAHKESGSKRPSLTGSKL